MWFPTHTRQGKANCLALTCILILTGSLSLTGCSQLPNLHARTPVQQLHAKLDDQLEPPVFDVASASVRIASMGDGLSIVEAPKPFAWDTLATSAGGRDINGITVGVGGYRTLVLGSLAGDDPLAIALTEEFAREVHRNSIILGGIEATFIRSPNPDGEVAFRMENANGAYLNRLFPADSNEAAAPNKEPEIKFLMGLLNEGMPQRVIHIRSYKGDAGLIAASSGAAATAKEVAEWLNFDLIQLPGKSSPGTLERFLSVKESCEVVTFAIPESSDKTSLWATYGDSLMNLLLDEDFETRKLARQNKAQTSADRRSRKLNAKPDHSGSSLEPQE